MCQTQQKQLIIGNNHYNYTLKTLLAIVPYSIKVQYSK